MTGIGPEGAEPPLTTEAEPTHDAGMTKGRWNLYGTEETQSRARTDGVRWHRMMMYEPTKQGKTSKYIAWWLRKGKAFLDWCAEEGKHPEMAWREMMGDDDE